MRCWAENHRMRTDKLKKSPWLIVGLVSGWILAPTLAVATTVITLQGANAKPVDATSARQLKVVETGVGNSLMTKNWSEGECKVMLEAPADKAIVVKSVVIDVYDPPTTPGPGNYVMIGVSNLCSDGFGVVRINPAGIETQTVEFPTGFALAAGDHLYLSTLGDISAEATINGYYVPASAVTQTTPILTPFILLSEGAPGNQ